MNRVSPSAKSNFLSICGVMPTRVFCVLLFLLLISGEYAQAEIEDQIYYRINSRVKGSPEVDDKWKPVDPNGMVDASELGEEKLIYFACNNDPCEKKQKWFSIRITGLGEINDDNKRLKYHCARAYKTQESLKLENKCRITAKKHVKSGEHRGELRYLIKWEPQPAWEFICFRKNNAPAKFHVRIFTICDSNMPDDYDAVACTRYDVSLNKKDKATADANYTEVEVFPEKEDVNTAAEPNFVPPLGSGPWQYEHIYEDPNGNPMPHGGVRWYTNGAGFGNGEEFDFSVPMASSINKIYWFYAYDSNAGTYVENWFYTGPEPNVISIESVMDHGGTEYSINIAEANNVEPRGSGISKIRITFGQPMDPNTTTDPNNVYICDNCPEIINPWEEYYVPPPTSSGTNNEVVTIDFNEPLSGPNCYTIYFTGMETTDGVEVGESVFSIRALVGDVSGNGIVDQQDIDEVILHIGQPLDSNNARYDINLDGIISASDMSIVQQHLNNKAAECLYLCPDGAYDPYLGDFKMDCIINCLDFAVLGERWYDTGCYDSNTPTWCNGVDMDESGNVDLGDLAIFAERWLQ